MEVKNCQRCNRNIEGGYICQRYDDKGNIVETFCHICSKVEVVEEYRKSKTIHTSLLTEATIAKGYFTERWDMSRMREEYREFYYQNRKLLLEVAESGEKMSKLVDRFDNEAWNKWLKKYWNDVDYRGHEAKVGKLSVLMWGCAGRVMITVGSKEPYQSFTMIFSDYNVTEDDIKKYGEMMKQKGGIQGITATEAEALDMLTQVLDANTKNKLKFKRNDNVHMLGL